ncbi:hypothetical protein AB1286_32310 [Trinickia sp. NRRL B-1857]|uniref:hypothetical protein n=1 Tax=Trinickia sp. NRRL B-1857 TaxID=3162879 RepID=UPI003D29C3AE
MADIPMEFLPDGFEPLRTYASERLALEVLSAAHARQDYDCVTASAEAIRGVFGPDNGWPDRDMTYVENLADLERHEQEFNARQAFAYAIFENAGVHGRRLYAGCLYIKPIKSRFDNDCRRTLFNAQAFCWFSTSTHNDLFGQLAAEELMQWIEKCWPFAAVAFPGRNISWHEWLALATASSS